MATEKNVSELIKDFITILQSRGRASATILAYRKDLEQLASSLSEKGKTTPDSVRSSDIEDFKTTMQKGGYTDKSVSRKLNAIKTFFTWLVSQKLIENDPAAPVAHPKYQNPPPRILSRMEYRALRDAARSDLRIRAIIELMLQTGVRIGEVANLRLEDISDKIFIRAYESQPQREVPLNETARDALNQYIAIRPKTTSDHIFVTKTGKPLLVRNIRSAIDRYFREAGIEKAKVNDLRNTFIVHQLKSGVDIVTVSKIAGHKRLSTTEHYLQFIDKREGKKGTKLEEL
ncbi:MAG: hypothetical protein A2694_02875 [Candidatus Blackburnbacteria bacterium RIFCSPHIGHO2_01_FULL_40_17]|uniref:Tyrosine recombinase XerC n=1 Tax=Candidatus Blackburnbacteria bacterium RIFCSPLOWO2_01_FULL_40_20 TaxID=1797519 RepID=A0A1G1VAU8_9BACT|nr:MAG: hypothetical protein A2694_02875 [Candidatus Blackburnbacteria bacterium RIFCSPHIGHO2_01_FULL_40_17]OGY12529.1 MAG: hypothetical protein A3A77_00975 [Candidatus Blackburnbacteria bacterium RIFCSPLOWO2_01_FULL_40_20]OGY15136.1 MAG: hypothetical protein A3I52_00090 [Candidatus Blackburnbacteria bacterium RIFCSPLOWO2_02_FULL_40_10]HBL51673.1 hypothetical protein [Candidatus Blackburnbacteria bacterium]